MRSRRHEEPERRPPFGAWSDWLASDAIPLRVLAPLALQRAEPVRVTRDEDDTTVAYTGMPASGAGSAAMVGGLAVGFWLVGWLVYKVDDLCKAVAADMLENLTSEKTHTHTRAQMLNEGGLVDDVHQPREGRWALCRCSPDVVH
jgi:hypothetical protein